MTHRPKGPEMPFELIAGSIAATGDSIEIQRELTVSSALTLEVNSTSGMRASNHFSPMLLANEITSAVDMTPFGGPRLGLKRTKKGALADLTLYMLVMHSHTPSRLVIRALGEDLVAKLTRKAEKIINAANDADMADRGVVADGGVVVAVAGGGGGGTVAVGGGGTAVVAGGGTVAVERQ